MTPLPPSHDDASQEGEPLPDVTVSDLVGRLVRLAAEIGCDGRGIGSHPGVRSRVRFVVDDPGIDLELAGIDVEQLPGCGCWSGVVFRLRAAEESRLPVERPEGGAGAAPGTGEVTAVR